MPYSERPPAPIHRDWKPVVKAERLRQLGWKNAKLQIPATVLVLKGGTEPNFDSVYSTTMR